MTKPQAPTRQPQRSEAVSGDEDKDGLTPIVAGRTKTNSSSSPVGQHLIAAIKAVAQKAFW